MVRRGHSESDKIICLGIESTAHTFSCSIAKLGSNMQGRILSNVKTTYTPPPGAGIHPREASRHHTEKAPQIVREALQSAFLGMNAVDAIAFSVGPGLGPCLRVGAVIARTLATYYRKPLVPVNHAVGHIELGALLTGAKDPVVLLVTGGHTLITAFASGRWRIFGEALDLTIGQLVDQLGREAGFSSPAGPKIEELASRSLNYMPLPYTVKGNDVSFSGILTAAKKFLQEGRRLEDLCFSVQETAFAMLAEVTERALAFSEKEEALVVGGVAANRRLAGMLREVAERHRAKIFIVPPEYSGDCGAQISWTGALEFRGGIEVPVERSFVRQSWRMDQCDIPWRG